MTIPPALIFVLPGGAYEFHADYEAEPVSEWLESLGYRSRSLRYPVAPGRHPAALEFVRSAIREARESYDGPVGVLGFSAGAHAAGLAALAPSDLPSEIPDFAILAYPVVLMGDGAHEISRLNLLGTDPAPSVVSSVSLEQLVTPDSPPFFLWHTADDEIVPASHSLRLASALDANGVDYELHVFPHGPHGLALAKDSGAPSAWLALCAEWIAHIVSRSTE
jgi:acetyl esterase/lipase